MDYGDWAWLGNVTHSYTIGHSVLGVSLARSHLRSSRDTQSINNQTEKKNHQATWVIPYTRGGNGSFGTQKEKAVAGSYGLLMGFHMVTLWVFRDATLSASIPYHQAQLKTMT